MSISKNGTTIRSLSDWEALAGPKSKTHWTDGRSAKETARAWLEGNGTSLPDEIDEAFARAPGFGRVLSWLAEPEAKLRFDSFPGEPRNSDLVVYANDASGSYLIGVEAKADEPFGETVGDALAAALDRYMENPRSNGLDRIRQLALSILGARRAGEPALKHIRYQLLTACAGVLCEAERRGYSRAVMLVHEFVTDRTVDARHQSNASDLNAFMTRLSNGSVTELASGEIAGPFQVPGAPLVSKPVDLFVGKVSRNIRASGAAERV